MLFRSTDRNAEERIAEDRAPVPLCAASFPSKTNFFTRSRRDVSALRGTRKLLRFADEVENHGSIFFAFAPGRSLGDVIFVLEAKDEVVLVAGLRELQISRALGLADQGRGPRRALVRSSERVKLLSDSRGILRL